MRGHIVKWVAEKGFGFIKPEKAEHDTFLHISKVIEGEPHYGADVEFKMDKDKTRTFAIDVRVLN